ELIQSNTDGLYVRLLNEDDFDIVDDMCYEWEQRTGMGLGFKYFDEVIQKDVNNYIMVDYETGHVKTKGAYVKSQHDLDYDLPIVNKAVIANLTKDIPVSQTVNDCTTLREFQRIVKLSYKYDGAMLGDRPVPGKVFAELAATHVRRKRLDKIKHGSREKIPYTPKHSIIHNGDVKDKPA